MIYDLIIVGAGPAGATAALYAERMGLSTLLLDKKHFPRDKICGDALSGKAVGIIRELGLLEEVEQLPGVKVNHILFGSSNHIEADVDLTRSSRPEYVTGFVIRRETFDNYLFDKARKVATKTLQGFAVKDIIRKDGLVCGVWGVQDKSQTEQEFYGRMILAADGYNSVVYQKLGHYGIDHKHWIFALRQYYKGVKGMSDKIELHYIDSVSPGYLWIFPLEDGGANVGIGMLSSAMRSNQVNLVRTLRDEIEQGHFAPRFADASPMEKPVGWHLPVGSLHRTCHGPGYMILGDAAGLIDPFTGEGISNAMYSARKAVEVARLAVNEADFSAGSLARYDERLWGEVGDELEVSTRLQKLGQVKPLFNYVIRKAARNERVRDILCAMIAEEIPRRQLTSPLFYLKLLTM